LAFITTHVQAISLSNERTWKEPITATSNLSVLKAAVINQAEDPESAITPPPAKDPCLHCQRLDEAETMEAHHGSFSRMG
jgi:hypothetical protein